MRIAILASEGAPYIKSGGLGDVMEALPAALARIPGNEIVLFLPYYQKVKEKYSGSVEFVTSFQVTLGWRSLYAGIFKLPTRSDGVTVYFLDNEYFFGARDGAIYGHIDDGERFAYFSKACLDAMCVLEYIPDIIQCNDWQTAPVPVFLKALYSPFFPKTRCMYTIHNIEYQGWAGRDFFDNVLGLPESYRNVMEMHGAVNVMKGAIVTADLVTTVSETYAQELMYPYFAHGLDGILSENSWKLTGITNGIDINTFNPETDPGIPFHYNVDTAPEGKAAIKAALQEEVGLPIRPEIPLLVMVTRLVEHKGLDLLQYIARRLLMTHDVQLLILGTGDAKYEQFFEELAQEFPDQVAAKIMFNLSLSSRIYAGGDIYLMPSKSEPCGLSQMNAMRYGTIPVVHATGGLRDTVPPCNIYGEGGLGFTFQSFNADDFMSAIYRSIELYWAYPENFRQLQIRCMTADFSWDKPAKKYMKLFNEMLSNT